MIWLNGLFVIALGLVIVVCGAIIFAAISSFFSIEDDL